MGGSASFGDGWRLEFAGWAAARVCGMCGGASLLEFDLVLFVRGLNGLGRCGWGSGHLVCDLRAGRLVGVVQVGCGFCCLDWAAMIDFFCRVRLTAVMRKVSNSGSFGN